MEIDIAPETVTYFKRLEAFRALPYVDRGGALAIGYGHSNKAGTLPVVVPGMVISEEEATRILTEVDIPHFWNAIKDVIKVPLTPHQRGALVLLSYNIGPTAFSKSSVLRYLNEGNYVKAATSFLMWNKSEGQIRDGLTLRRAEEIVLFRHGWWEK